MEFFNVTRAITEAPTWLMKDGESFCEGPPRATPSKSRSNDSHYDTVKNIFCELNAHLQLLQVRTPISLWEKLKTDRLMSWYTQSKWLHPAIFPWQFTSAIFSTCHPELAEVELHSLTFECLDGCLRGSSSSSSWSWTRTMVDPVCPRNGLPC